MRLPSIPLPPLNLLKEPLWETQPWGHCHAASSAGSATLSSLFPAEGGQSPSHLCPPAHTAPSARSACLQAHQPPPRGQRLSPLMSNHPARLLGCSSDRTPTELEHCSYWAWALQLLSPSTEATEPKHCGYWAWALWLLSLSTETTETEHCNYWAQALRPLSSSTAATEPEQCNYWDQAL